MTKRTVLVLLFVFLLASVSLAAEYSDGTYEAANDMVKVSVTIEEGKIAEIEILEHGGGGKKYEEMIEPLIEKIIEEQSTEVDGITGATVSSDKFKEAVEKALNKAKIVPEGE